MRNGIVLHGAERIDLSSAMEEIAEAGFDTFEYSHGHVLNLEREGPGSFRRAAEEAESRGLEPVQLHGPSLERGFDLGSPDERTRRKSVERSCLWIEHCAVLNVPVMVEHGCEFHEDFARTMQLVKSSFRQIARCAEENGVRVAIENEFDPRELAAAGQGRNMVVPARVGCLIPELMEIILEDEENLGVCLDFGHANLQRSFFSLDKAIRDLSHHLFATHIHDNEGISDQHMIPLFGNIPWDRAMDALREIGYRRPIILEVGGLSSMDRSVRMNRLRLYKMVADYLSSSSYGEEPQGGLVGEQTR